MPVKATTAAYNEAVDAWEQICRSLERSRHVYLFMDFDGRAAARRSSPGSALIEDDVKHVLGRLSGQKMVSLAILSSRSVDDLAAHVGLPVIYAGDHGLEIRGPAIYFVVPGAESVHLQIPSICNEIRQAIQRIPGAVVEARRLTASLHFRRAAPDHVPALIATVRGCLESSGFEMQIGDRVLEVRPRLKWGKADAVRWIMDRHGAPAEQAICIGDDDADEEIFRRIPAAVNVRIVNTERAVSAAGHCIAPSEVPAFLNGVLDLVHGITV